MGMVRLQQNPKAKSKEAYLANISGGGIGLYSHKRLRLVETYYIRPMSWNNLDELCTIKAEGDFIIASFKFTSMTDQSLIASRNGFFSLFVCNPIPLTMGKGWDGGGYRGHPPTFNPPIPRRRRSYFF
jgi:hypothetical protein